MYIYIYIYILKKTFIVCSNTIESRMLWFDDLSVLFPSGLLHSILLLKFRKQIIIGRTFVEAKISFVRFVFINFLVAEAPIFSCGRLGDTPFTTNGGIDMFGG